MPLFARPVRRLALLAAAAALAAAAPAVAATPPLTGVAVAVRHDSSESRIVRLGLDGTAQPLTIAAERAERPKLSADGRRVVYEVETATGSEVWVMDAAGTHKRQVTRLGGLATAPAISPDHARVVFAYHASAKDAPQLYEIPVAGGRATRLTWGGRGSSEADFSPDGRTIAYTAWPSNAANGLTRLFTMRADGSGKRKLTAEPARRPDFSPDGRRIAFELVAYAGHALWEPTPQYRGFRIGTVGADGRGLWRESFEDPRVWHAQPVWAPDSRRLMIRSEWIAFNPTLVVFTPGGTTPYGIGDVTQVSPDELPVYDDADWTP